MSNLSQGRPYGKLLSRLIGPVAILFGATLWFVVSTIVVTSDGLNEVALERQRAELQGAIDQHVGALRSRIVDVVDTSRMFASPDGMALDLTGSLVAQQLGAMRDFDGIGIYHPDGTRVAGAIRRDGGEPGPTAVASRLSIVISAALAFPLSREMETRGRAKDLVATRLSFDGTVPFVSLAVPLLLGRESGLPDGSLVVIAADRTLSAERLGRIAGFRGIGEVAASAAVPADGRGAIPIRGPDGEPAAYLTWTPDRPGDRLRDRLVPSTVLGCCVVLVLFGLSVAYLRWVVGDLAATETRSRDLLGRDPLSGLANRMRFGETLDRQLATLPRDATVGLAVLFIDLDRFKDVNDTYGHQAGDDLIRLVAQRLVNLTRGGDTIARFGGDEFAIIQPGVRSQGDAATLARRILDALTQPFTLSETSVIVGASIGIAVAPEHGTGREELMGLADTALYQAKSEGRNRFSFFQSRMDEAIRMRKVVEDDLRRAIGEHELVLHYQPLFSSDGVTIVGLEALVRWPHPTRGLISPGEFIPVAEERGLVIPLGEWVLRRACLDGMRWPGLRIAVNVSPVQFRHRDFVSKVMALLDETGFDPGRLELELTEGVVVEDADAAENAMMELRALGIHLALDDFGTGYSSLIYLRRFAFDTIKIDRSFLESMEATGESAILVHSMVHLGRALGLTVTAEGVETAEQHRFLQALGCHQLQGFLFSKPVPAERIDEMLGIAPSAKAAA